MEYDCVGVPCCCNIHTHVQDFLQLLVHHVTTVVLMFLCYFTHTLPLGCLILLTHDLSDVLLEVRFIDDLYHCK